MSLAAGRQEAQDRGQRDERAGGEPDDARGDTTVYAGTAALSYRINPWLSAQAAYVFTHQDERGSDDITRHGVTLGLIATYPYRIY